MTQIESLVFAARERPLLDFIREVLPKIKDALVNIDLDGIIAAVKMTIEFLKSIGVLTVAAQSCDDAEIEAALKQVLAEEGGAQAAALDFQKLFELIKLIISIFWPKPETPAA